MNVSLIRKDFPILHQRIHGKSLIYLDSAATSQMPLSVIKAIEEYARNDNSNVHRAIHTLGERATAHYEGARAKVARFIGAPAPQQVIFVRNTTEAINLVAWSWGMNIHPGDELLLTPMEHHSNLIPWQQLARRRGAKLMFMPLRSDGTIDLQELPRLITKKTRLIAVTHVSNVLGVINPIQEIISAARQVGARVFVDGAQSVPHMPVDVKALDCDFLAFSGHKMCGPMGIGVLYGKADALEEMEPLMFGGEMISTVSLETADWKELPWRFEAGTPNVVGAVGLAAAIDYLTELGMDSIHAHEQQITRYAVRLLKRIPGVTIYGPEHPRGGLVTFNLGDIHPHDVATVLDQEGIAVRAGHHCCQPLMRWLDVPATVRASFYLYTTEAEIDALAHALEKTKEFFGHGIG
ncbi:MAG: cysteine desulfurase [Firmicutes bacterium]|jgi:cysteine desulfurase/selenocysteine lyase|nr:cysteine desulfurase [Bacillota bacterium]